MRGSAVRLLVSWLPVVALTIVVVSLWDLRYEPGGCTDILTDASEDTFATWGWVLRVAQWVWALVAGGLLLRARSRADEPPPSEWRTAAAIVGGLLLVALSGVLLAQDGFVLLVGFIVLGAGGLVVAALVAVLLLVRVAHPPGFALALAAWLGVCLLLAPLGLGVLTASDAGTLC